MNKKFLRSDGFTLVEMTIVIVIASLIIAAGLALFRPYFAQQQIERTASSVRTVELAMRDFFEANGRYPCPASYRTPRGDANDGIERCGADGTNVYTAGGLAYTGGLTRSVKPVLIGAVPYRALNIPVSATIDANANRLTYVVSGESTVTGTYDDNLERDTPSGSAAIDVVDESGTSISMRDLGGSVAPEPISKHYYFFSHGSDGAGAFTNEGRPNARSCGGTMDSENCDLDGRFIAAARSLGAASSYNDDVSNESLIIDSNLNDSLWARNPANENRIYNINSEHVGIGTGPSTPAETMLHVKGSGAEAQITFERDSKKIWIDPNDGGSNLWSQIALDTGMGFQFLRYDGGSTWTSLVNITNAGNVGIGTETPEEQLHTLGDFVQDLSPAGPARYTAATGGDGNGQWTHLGMMDNSFGSTGVNNDSNQYGVRVNWDSDRLILGLENNGPDRKDGIIGLRTGNLSQDSLQFEIDGNKLVTLKAYVDGVPYTDGSNPVVGHLGVGLNNPERILDVNRNLRIRSAGAEWWTSLDIWHNLDSATINPAITMYRGRGTFEAPTGAQSGDVMGVFDVRGTTSIITPPLPAYGSGLFMRATENHGNDRMGTDLNLMTVLNGDYRGTSRMRIFHDGRIIMGNNVFDTVPAARLDVQGQIKISNDGLAAPCDAAAEGSQRYNPTLKLMQFCDGSGTWKVLGGGALFVDSGTLEHGDTIPLPAGATDRSSCEVMIGVHSVYADGNQGVDELYCAQDPSTGVVTSWFSKEDNGRFYTPGTVWCSYMIICRS